MVRLLYVGFRDSKNLWTKNAKLLSSMSFPLRCRNQRTIPRNSQLLHHCSGYFNHWRWRHYVASKGMYPITQRCMSYPRRIASSFRYMLKWLISHLYIFFFIMATTSEQQSIFRWIDVSYWRFRARYFSCLICNSASLFGVFTVKSRKNSSINLALFACLSGNVQTGFSKFLRYEISWNCVQILLRFTRILLHTLQFRVMQYQCYVIFPLLNP